MTTFRTIFVTAAVSAALLANSAFAMTPAAAGAHRAVAATKLHGHHHSHGKTHHHPHIRHHHAR